MNNLQEYFSLHGAPTSTGGNDPLPLIDPGAVWLVTRGRVDIVAMTITRAASMSEVHRTHLLRIETGQLLFGFRAPPAGHHVLLLGYGVGETQVARMPVSRLSQGMDDPALAAETAKQVDQWITSISELCSGDFAPNGSLNLRPSQDVELLQGQSAQPQSGVLWVRPLAGDARFMGLEGSRIALNNGMFPLGRDAWITAEDSFVMRTHCAEEVISDDAYWQGLATFQNAVESVIDIQRTLGQQAARQRLAAKRHADRSTMNAAVTNLESILAGRTSVACARLETDNDLAAACRLVGEHLGIEVREPSMQALKSGLTHPLELIAKASRFALRRVELTADWYRQDHGPLLGFLKHGHSPVALLPTSARSYEVHDVRTGTVKPMTRRTSRLLEPAAFMFYRTLPDRAIHGLDMLQFAVRGVGRDLAIVALMGALGGLLALATPLAVGHVFDSVLPAAGRDQLWQVVMGLGVAAFATAAFHLTRNIAMLRVQHRSATSLQAAVWDRVINLPARFFTKYSAGDLGMRAMGVDSILDLMSTSAVSTILTSVFSAFSLALLFYYSPTIAMIALAMVVFVGIVTFISGVMQVRHYRAIEEENGKIAGMLLQFITGIAKIRIAAAENRAFAQWSERFSLLTRLSLRSRTVANRLGVFYVLYPTLTFVVLFALIATQGSDGRPMMTTGAFLAFLAAYATLLSGIVDLGQTAVNMLGIVPVYQRLKPILLATPEVQDVKADPGLLRGRIEASSVSFRYEPDGPLILDNVSFHAEPGEFIALVGPSGSGKSTLLRILLGFEKPDSGTISYDGFDAAGLDPRALRRQLGVVLQDGDLLPGDVYSNIVGSAVDLTHQDAWEAARLAGLDKDIEDMPMGMHTVINEGATTLSGGQRQRLMIARALVTRPRIVYFDEATSALDNPTQRIVTESLDRLRATRIVVAHRLSTIQGADRIFVLVGGRVVQSGTYSELVSKPGMFLELVKRQME